MSDPHTSRENSADERVRGDEHEDTDAQDENEQSHFSVEIGHATLMDRCLPRLRLRMQTPNATCHLRECFIESLDDVGDLRHVVLDGRQSFFDVVRNLAPELRDLRRQVVHVVQYGR